MFTRNANLVNAVYACIVLMYALAIWAEKGVRLYKKKSCGQGLLISFQKVCFRSDSSLKIDLLFLGQLKTTRNITS